MGSRIVGNAKFFGLCRIRRVKGFGFLKIRQKSFPPPALVPQPLPTVIILFRTTLIS